MVEEIAALGMVHVRIVQPKSETFQFNEVLTCGIFNGQSGSEVTGESDASRVHKCVCARLSVSFEHVCHV